MKKLRFFFQEIVTPQDVTDHFIIYSIKLSENRYHALSAAVPPESVAYFTLCHFKLQSILLSTSGPSVLKFLKRKKARIQDFSQTRAYRCSLQVTLFQKIYRIEFCFKQSIYRMYIIQK
jgi:hypothetical protein